MPSAAKPGRLTTTSDDDHRDARPPSASSPAILAGQRRGDAERRLADRQEAGALEQAGQDALPEQRVAEPDDERPGGDAPSAVNADGVGDVPPAMAARAKPTSSPSDAAAEAADEQPGEDDRRHDEDGGQAGRHERAWRAPSASARSA